MEQSHLLRIIAAGGALALASPGIGRATASATDYAPVTLTLGTAIHATLNNVVDATKGEKVAAIVTEKASVKSGSEIATVIPRGAVFSGFYDTTMANGKRLLVWTHLRDPGGAVKNLVQYDRTTASGYRVGHSDFVTVLGPTDAAGPVTVLLEGNVSLIPVSEKAVPKPTPLPPKLLTASARMPTGPQSLTGILKAARPGAVGATFVPTLPTPPAVKAYHAPAPALPAPPPPPPRPPVPTWTLTAGKPIGKQLAVWAHRAGWAVDWEVGKDWTAPRETTMRGQFWTKSEPHGVAGTVISDIANQLVEQGRRPIEARFYVGNKTLVVKRAGGNNS